MEDNLKDFGTLLKESLANRGEEIPASDASITVSDSERDAILEKVAKSNQKIPAQPPSAGTSQTEDTSTVPFGVLLERTAKLRSEMEEDDHKAEDEIREVVIGKSKMQLTEDLMKRLIR